MISIMPTRRLTRFIAIVALVLVTVAIFYNPLTPRRHQIPTSHSTWQAELGPVDNKATSYVAEATPAELCAPYHW